jgi:hypothetical protein
VAVGVAGKGVGGGVGCGGTVAVGTSPGGTGPVPVFSSGAV